MHGCVNRRRGRRQREKGRKEGRKKENFSSSFDATEEATENQKLFNTSAESFGANASCETDIFLANASVSAVRLKS
jgi:hypothetical protein